MTNDLKLKKIFYLTPAWSKFTLSIHKYYV